MPGGGAKRKTPIDAVSWGPVRRALHGAPDAGGFRGVLGAALVRGGPAGEVRPLVTEPLRERACGRSGEHAIFLRPFSDALQQEILALGERFRGSPEI